MPMCGRVYRYSRCLRFTSIHEAGRNPSNEEMIWGGPLAVVVIKKGVSLEKPMT